MDENASLLTALRAHWKGVFLFIMPIFYGILVLVFGDQVPNRLVYINIILLIGFIAELFPMGLIAMLPVGFYPLQNIMFSEDSCVRYFHPYIAEFILGLLALTGMEATKYHQREALIFIKLFGPSVKGIQIGIVVLTTFLAIILPSGVAAGIMFFLTRKILANLASMGVCQLYTEETKDDIPTKRKPTNPVLGLYLSIAYCASLANGCTITSSSANISMRDMYNKQFPNSKEALTFNEFMSYGMPPSLLNIVLVALYIQIVFFGLFRSGSQAAQESSLTPEAKQAASALNTETLNEMGSINTAQIISLLTFSVSVVLIVTMAPDFTEGWAEQFPAKIGKATPISLSLVLMFMVPASLNFLFCWDEKSGEKTPGLVSWKVSNGLMPWDVIGLGMSAVMELAVRTTQLNKSLYGVLDSLHGGGSLKITVLKVVLLTAFCTNYILDFAAITFETPALMELSVRSSVHPLYFLLPASLAVNLAFLLPVSSMPAALLKYFMNIHVLEMIKYGILPFTISLIVVYLWVVTGGMSIYEMESTPGWLTNPKMAITYPLK